MGREIGSTEYTRSQRTRYRRVLRRNLDLFETFLDTAEFVDEGTVASLEMNLARTDTMAPALLADLLLEDLDDDSTSMRSAATTSRSTCRSPARRAPGCASSNRS